MLRIREANVDDMESGFKILKGFGIQISWVLVGSDNNEWLLEHDRCSSFGGVHMGAVTHLMEGSGSKEWVGELIDQYGLSGARELLEVL